MERPQNPLLPTSFRLHQFHTRALWLTSFIVFYASMMVNMPALSAIYQCKDADGKTYFQDQACSKSQKETIIEKDQPPKPESKKTNLKPFRVNSLPEPTAKLAKGQRYALNKDVVNSDAWKTVLEMVKSMPAIKSGHGKLSVVRVYIENPTEDDMFQAQSTKLKYPTEMYGGGAYRKLKSGDFLIIEHINSYNRQNNKDTLILGSTEHGRTELLIPVPKPGSVQAFGDIILSRASEDERSILVLKVETPKGAKQVSSVRLGPITVGGPYGKKFVCNKPTQCEIGALAPGNYWLLFDHFDPVKSRWEFNLKPSSTLEMKFKSTANNTIERVLEN